MQDHAAAVAALEADLEAFAGKHELTPADLNTAISMVERAFGLFEQCKFSGHSPVLYVVSPKHRRIIKAGVIFRTRELPLEDLLARLERDDEFATFKVGLDQKTELVLEQFHRAALLSGVKVASVLAPVGPVDRFKVHICGQYEPGMSPENAIKQALCA